MKDKNYIVIQGWMVNRLKLSGNELMVYAVIYGFSQDGESKYEGSGQYIADSLGISRRAVFSILNSLVDKGYIEKFERFERNLKFCDYKAAAAFLPKEDKKESGEETSPVVKNLHTGGEESSPVVKNLHTGGEESSPVGDEETSPHITNSYINNTAAAIEQPDSNADPPPAGGKAAAAVVFTPDNIKTALAALDNRLFFDKGFYQKAAAFLSLHKLDLKYLEWLHEQCGLKKPDSFDGMYLKLFFAENKIEQFKALNKPLSPTPPPVFSCPLCGAAHGRYDKKCASCGLPDPYSAKEEQISLYKELLKLPPEKREEYFLREDKIYSECGLDFENMNNSLAALKHEFGVTAA